jgi:hypothetical protein
MLSLLSFSSMVSSHGTKDESTMDDHNVDHEVYMHPSPVQTSRLATSPPSSQ